jgi:ABC-type polysaccharide/polyol phosphate transport system ATPase subunit
MALALRIEKISKRYVLGEIDRRSLLAQWRARLGLAGPSPEEFWALRDISFDLQQGEVLGILGHNGAGKSTLLKILAQITAPTSGRVCLRGRIASLLEVGTGFHPDLTGRDNIFLNGSILGMTTREVLSKFDEIVAFSGIEQFIDTPVKRYSSGMRVRLAFAVAAHLEPEILIIDEVLAVGDAAFQKKCLGKIGSVASTGRTVIFVSHNTTAVRISAAAGLCWITGSSSSMELRRRRLPATWHCWGPARSHWRSAVTARALENCGLPVSRSMIRAAKELLRLAMVRIWRSAWNSSVNRSSGAPIWA